MLPKRHGAWKEKLPYCRRMKQPECRISLEFKL
jgi:hypothetical protein